MKHRNPILVLVFSLLTGGIYFLYWLGSTRNTLNLTVKDKVPTIWLMAVPYLISLATVPLFFIASLASGNYSSNYNNSYSTNFNSAPAAQPLNKFIIVLLIFEFISIFIILPITFYWTYKFSKAIDEYTNGEFSTVLTFVVIWLLSYIGGAILQDKFNNFTPSSVAAVMPVGTAPIAPPAYNPSPTQPVEPQPHIEQSTQEPPATPPEQE